MRNPLFHALLGILASGCAASPTTEADDDEGPLGTSRAAVLSLSIEAEGSTGAGTTESDPTASGGQLLALSQLYTEASKAFTASDTIVDGSVRVRGDAACLGQQWFDVRVDGIVRGSQQVTSTSWTTFPLNVNGIAAGDHTLTFRYRAGVSGCAIRYDQVTLSIYEPPPPPPPPLKVEAETATGAGVIENDATASNGQRLAISTPLTTATASFNASTGYGGGASVTARSSGTCGSQTIAISIDGSLVSTHSVSQTSWTTIQLPYGGLAAGNHTMGFQYRSGKSGCPVYFDVATFQ